ncbi:MAG: hypothetical protein AB2735_17695, partial [Candidatus Thiodiazotropha taylori]
FIRVHKRPEWCLIKPYLVGQGPTLHPDINGRMGPFTALSYPTRAVCYAEAEIFRAPNKKTPAPAPWAPGSCVALIGWQMVSVLHFHVHVHHSLASFSATVKV